MAMLPTKSSNCTFPDDTKDALEQKYGGIIREEIPGYAHFWEQFIGSSDVRDAEDVGPYRPRFYPYKLVATSDISNEEKSRVERWHWAVCDAHYSFLCNWIEARYYTMKLLQHCEPSWARDSCWLETHWRHFECGLMRVGNARNMALRLWWLLSQLRTGADKFYIPEREILKWLKELFYTSEGLNKTNVPKELLEAIEDLLSLSAIRNLVVHSARTWARKKGGMVWVPFLEKPREFNGWRYYWCTTTQDEPRHSSDTFLKDILDRLTNSFNISQQYLSEKMHQVLDDLGFRLEWEANNDT